MRTIIKKILLPAIALSAFVVEIHAQCVTIINLPDTIQACKNTTVQLSPSLTVSGGSLLPLDTTWTPAAGLSNPDIINPIATIGTTSVQYKLTIQALTPTNFVNNGDFSAGVTGFTTSYIPGTGGPFGLLSNEGTYAVTSNPSLVHNNFANFFDHTTGNNTGKMLVVNGASTANVNIWCQTFAVIPNTYYDFSAWGASCVVSSPAILQFAVNGTSLGTPLALPTTTGTWVQFHAVWFSGANTSINICIVDQQTAASGNDFALDDIAFRQICYSYDSVYIKVTNLQPAINKTIKLGCAQDTVNFSAINNGETPTQYIWDFGDASGSQLQNPQHVYTTQGVFTIKLVTKKSGCADSASTQIDTRHPIKAAFTSDKDSVCIGTPIQFTQTDVTSSTPAYFWDFGDGTTDNAASPSHNYTAPGVYTVVHVITDQVPCHDTAKKIVIVFPGPSITFDIQDSVICVGARATMSSTATPGFQKLLWDFGDGSSLPLIPSTIHAYDKAGNYIVTLTVDYPICPSAIKTHTVTVLPQPIVNLGRDTTLCPYSEPIVISNLINDPAVNYVWSTGATGASILAKEIGIYWLKGTTVGGCSAADSIEIIKACYLDIPNSFTPDGDGTNDYFFPRQLLSSKLKSFKMQIFTRWGQVIFETTSINGRGWDGKFNDKPQQQGVYIYLIEAEIEGLGKEKYQGNVTLLR